MDAQPCDALHEIQEGRLDISAFLPRRVYESGLYERFHVTIGELRRHLTGCDSCAALDVPRIQLEDINRKGFDLVGRVIHEALEDLDGCLADAACFWHSEDEDSSWIIVEHEVNRAYSDLVKSQVLLGSFLEELFGPVVHGTILAFVVDARHGRVGFEPGLDMNQTGVLSNPLVQQLVAGKDDRLVTALLRAALLWRGFGDYMTALDVETWAASGGKYAGRHTVSKETTDSISWLDVWRDYSALAEFETWRLLSTRSTEITLKTDHNMTSLSDGQTAMMGLLLELTAAAQKSLDMHGELARGVQRLHDAYKRVPADIKDQCIATVRGALGSRYDEISEPSRRFLLTAEFCYVQPAPDLDWSVVIVQLKKAFETQLKIVLQPFSDEIESMLVSDFQKNKPLPKLTLGDLARIFQEKKVDVEAIMKQNGLNYAAIRKAITEVNVHTDAKHSAVKSMADATTFRSLFFGTRSVMCTLFPEIAQPEAI